MVNAVLTDITLFGLQTQFECNQKITAKTNTLSSPRTEFIIPSLVAENRKFRFGLIDYPDPDSSKAGVLIASSVVDLSKPVPLVKEGRRSDITLCSCHLCRPEVQYPRPFFRRPGQEFTTKYELKRETEMCCRRAD
ncbi:hypothetical protein TNCV_2919161 [Trichonephila clavipes]|nr:hypothetical protein TNCV_2919161 [Trichonephila clavipes]